MDPSLVISAIAAIISCGALLLSVRTQWQAKNSQKMDKIYDLRIRTNRLISGYELLSLKYFAAKESHPDIFVENHELMSHKSITLNLEKMENALSTSQLQTEITPQTLADYEVFIAKQSEMLSNLEEKLDISKAQP